jgi:hypothetical protein
MQDVKRKPDAKAYRDAIVKLVGMIGDAGKLERIYKLVLRLWMR